MIKVAIVEDSPVIRQSLATIVNQAAGLKCVGVCATAEEALEKIPRLAPDVILMDIQLPMRSGIECAAQIKPQLPGAQIVMVTVYEDMDRILRAFKAGACGYLLKRSTPEQIVAAIREAQQGGVPMTGGVARRLVASIPDPAPPAAPALPELSEREKEILNLVADGLSDKEVAQKIGVSNWTVYWHLKNVYVKLHVRSRTQAVLKFRGQPPLRPEPPH
jgi:DNA-binding NarL/FixJ family response regulator